MVFELDSLRPGSIGTHPYTLLYSPKYTNNFCRWTILLLLVLVRTLLAIASLDGTHAGNAAMDTRPRRNVSRALSVILTSSVATRKLDKRRARCVYLGSLIGRPRAHGNGGFAPITASTAGVSGRQAASERSVPSLLVSRDARHHRRQLSLLSRPCLTAIKHSAAGISSRSLTRTDAALRSSHATSCTLGSCVFASECIRLGSPTRSRPSRIDSARCLGPLRDVVCDVSSGSGLVSRRARGRTEPDSRRAGSGRWLREQRGGPAGVR